MRPSTWCVVSSGVPALFVPLQLGRVGVAPARLQDRGVLARLLARRLAARLEHHLDEGAAASSSRRRVMRISLMARHGPLVEQGGAAVHSEAYQM